MTRPSRVPGAAGSERDQMEKASAWQPIETFREEAETCIVWNGVDCGEAIFVHGYRRFWVWMSDVEVDPPPTHWQPLPDPPASIPVTTTRTWEELCKALDIKP